MNRVSLTAVGFILMTIGFLSLILSTIGLRFKPLAFIDEISGPLLGFVIKLILMLLGIVLFYKSRINPEDFE